jgi:hypothetical protein
LRSAYIVTSGVIYRAQKENPQVQTDMGSKQPNRKVGMPSSAGFMAWPPAVFGALIYHIKFCEACQEFLPVFAVFFHKMQGKEEDFHKVVFFCAK